MTQNNQGQSPTAMFEKIWPGKIDQNKINVGDYERIGSVITGSVFTLYGLTRKSWLTRPLALIGGYLVQRGMSGTCALYQAFNINTARQGGNTNATLHANRAIKVKRAVTINKPVAELYSYWRNLENLPQIMEHLESVTVKDDKTSHWVAKGPAGITVDWDAEIFREKENEIIAWKSVEGASVPNAGTVQFTDLGQDRGTEILVELDYDPPVGVIGAAFAKLFGEEPNQQIQEDLRHFKQKMEAGELPTTKGQPSGRQNQ
jgi:uncharacterized membrane protein